MINPFFTLVVGNFSWIHYSYFKLRLFTSYPNTGFCFSFSFSGTHLYTVYLFFIFQYPLDRNRFSFFFYIQTYSLLEDVA